MTIQEKILGMGIDLYLLSVKKKILWHQLHCYKTSTVEKDVVHQKELERQLQELIKTIRLLHDELVSLRRMENSNNRRESIRDRSALIRMGFQFLPPDSKQNLVLSGSHSNISDSLMTGLK